MLLLKAPNLIFAEIFVPQNFIIRAAPGFSGPANMCAGRVNP